MTKAKVLILNGTLFIGGAEHIIANLVRNIDHSDIELVIGHLKSGGVVRDELLSEGYNVQQIPQGKKRRASYLSWYRLRQFVKKNRINVIHSHDLASFFDAALCRLFTRKIKHIHTFHFGNYPYRPNKLYLFLEKLLWRIADKRIAVGNTQKKAIQQTFKMKNSQIQTVWNGIDEPKPDVIEQIAEKQNKDKVLIGSISTLIPQKAINDLLDAIKIVSQVRTDFELIIVGDGILKKELMNYSEKIGVDSYVTWLGWVPNASQTVLPAMDIFVQSSHWEAMSVVILEGMAEGKAILATDVGENSDVLINDKTGLVVKKGDVESFAKNLIALISDKEKRKTFGAAAQQRYKDLFTAKVMARNYEKLYLELV